MLSTRYWYNAFMRISVHRIKSLCRERGESVAGMLVAAGVSRNAFYTLARRPSILPRSIMAIAKQLGVGPGAVLTGEDRQAEEMRGLMAEVDDIARRYPGVDRENVRHALLLLKEPPINRLRRALVRARRPAPR